MSDETNSGQGERILVPFDGSPLSERALERALTAYPDARITTLYVIDPVLAVYEAETKGLPAASSWADRARERADELATTARELAGEHDIEMPTATRTGRPAREILAYVDEHAVDHVIMGSHGRSGVPRLVLGSVAEQVVRQSPVPVTIVR